MKRTDFLKHVGLSTGMSKQEVSEVRSFTVTGTVSVDNDNVQLALDLGDGSERRMWAKSLGNRIDKLTITTKANNKFPWTVTIPEELELWVNNDGIVAIGEATEASSEETPAWAKW